MVRMEENAMEGKEEKRRRGGRIDTVKVSLSEVTECMCVLTVTTFMCAWKHVLGCVCVCLCVFCHVCL